MKSQNPESSKDATTLRQVEQTTGLGTDRGTDNMNLTSSKFAAPTKGNYG